MRRTFYFVIIGVLLFCVFVTAAHAATITVTSTNDSGPGSLRQALRDAHDGDTITFAVTGTIVLTSGGLPVNKNVTISGPGADQLSIDGKLNVNNCILSTNSGGGISNGHDGGHAVLTVIHCEISGNSYGIYNDHGESSVTNCIVSSNQYG